MVFDMKGHFVGKPLRGLAGSFLDSAERLKTFVYRLRTAAVGNVVVEGCLERENPIKLAFPILRF